MAKRPDYGGGTTVRRITLSEGAAVELRRRVAPAGTRYRKAAADEAASAILEGLADGTMIILFTAEVAPALAWLQEARGMCFSEAGARSLDLLIAAIVAATRR